QRNSFRPAQTSLVASKFVSFQRNSFRPAQTSLVASKFVSFRQNSFHSAQTSFVAAKLVSSRPNDKVPAQLDPIKKPRLLSRGFFAECRRNGFKRTRRCIGRRF